MSENEKNQQTEETEEEAVDTEPEIIDAEQEDEADADSLEQEGNESTEALLAEIDQLKQKVLRQQADYDNFRKRTRLEKEADAKYRSQKLIESLLPAMDNFARALGHQAESEEAQNLHKGMEMVYEQLLEALKSEGLQEIATEEEVFDPNFHQAVMQVEEEGFESNQVVEELQKGYQLNDRVIRPAMVKVNA